MRKEAVAGSPCHLPRCRLPSSHPTGQTPALPACSAVGHCHRCGQADARLHNQCSRSLGLWPAHCAAARLLLQAGSGGTVCGWVVRGYSVGRCRGTFDVVKEWAERWAGICLPPSSLTSLLRPCQSLPSLCRTAAASAGVVLGPLVQWICYTWLVSRMDWEAEAVKAHRYMLEVADSMSGAGI